jgi:hypothetical protein
VVRPVSKGNGASAPNSEASDFARALEQCGAERDVAVEYLDKLEAIMARHGGYMAPADQYIIGGARAFLEAIGRRKRAPHPEWRNRG